MLTVKNFGLRKIYLAVFAVLLAVPLSSVAQVTTATIVGTVSDPSGSGVPGAPGTRRNVDMGLPRTGTSGDSGAYRIEFLPVGKYEVEVTYTGFKKALLNGIVLQINDTARGEVSLAVGQVGETVTGADSAPPEVNTSTPEIGRTMQAGEIASLPLVERNVYTLLDLTPGVEWQPQRVAGTAAPPPP